MTFMRSGLVAIVSSIGVIVSCSYSQPKEPESGGSTEVTPPPPKTEGEPAPAPADEAAPAAPTGACDDRACSADFDCCKGYGCGFDPERSKVQRFCLPQ